MMLKGELIDGLSMYGTAFKLKCCLALFEKDAF